MYRFQLENAYARERIIKIQFFEGVLPSVHIRTRNIEHPKGLVSNNLTHLLCFRRIHSQRGATKPHS